MLSVGTKGIVRQADGVQLQAEVTEAYSNGTVRIKVRTWGTEYQDRSSPLPYQLVDAPVHVGDGEPPVGVFLANPGGPSPTKVAQITALPARTGQPTPADVLAKLEEMSAALDALSGMALVAEGLRTLLVAIPDPAPGELPSEVAAALRQMRVALGGPESLPDDREARREARLRALDAAEKRAREATPAAAGEPAGSGPVVEVKPQPQASPPASEGGPN